MKNRKFFSKISYFFQSMKDGEIGHDFAENTGEIMESEWKKYNMPACIPARRGFARTDRAADRRDRSCI